MSNNTKINKGQKMKNINLSKGGMETLGIPSTVINASWQDEALLNALDLERESAFSSQFELIGGSEEGEKSYNSPKEISLEAERKMRERARHQQYGKFVLRIGE